MMTQSVSDSRLGDTMPLLKELEALMATRCDPFDNDIGELPMLVFFLCERHTHYVDIAWSSEELQFMPQLSAALLGTIGCSSEWIKDSTRVKAAELLTTIVASFPAHRVTNRMSQAFKRDAVSSALRTMRNLVPFDGREGRVLVVRFLSALSSFGLNRCLTAELVPQHLIWAVGVNILPEMRCACQCCEFRRRLIKLARERDECGVPGTADAMRTVCDSIRDAGLADIISNVLQFEARDRDLAHEVETGLGHKVEMGRDVGTRVGQESATTLGGAGLREEQRDVPQDRTELRVTPNCPDTAGHSPSQATCGPKKVATVAHSQPFAGADALALVPLSTEKKPDGKADQSNLPPRDFFNPLAFGDAWKAHWAISGNRDAEAADDVYLHVAWAAMLTSWAFERGCSVSVLRAADLAAHLQRIFEADSARDQ
eukprot:Polyplicarium_translucidae@DN2465_c0_g1_i2.p1